MKKHIFWGGGGGPGESECTVSPGDVHHFGFYNKKNQRRLDEAGSAMNVACFHTHFG